MTEVSVIATVTPETQSIVTHGIPGPSSNPLTLIDDAKTATDKTWSSDKVAAEIGAVNLSNYYTKPEADTLLSEKESTGTAANAVNAHLTATDPHPQYQTQAESDTRYDALGAANSAVSSHIAATSHLTASQVVAAAPVQSVAGKTGAVTLGITDTAGLQDALGSKAAISHVHPGLLPLGGTAGQVLAKSNAADYAANWVNPPSSGGSAPTRFQRGAGFFSTGQLPVVIPVACTMKAALIRTAGGPGSCSFDVQRNGVSLCGTAKPTLSNGTESTDSTLTGWTIALAALDTLWIVCESLSGFSLADLTLILEPV